VFEVSTCGEDRGGCGHVRIVGCDMLFLVVASVFLQSNLCFLFFGPKMNCWDLFFVRNSLNQRLYFGGRVRDVPMGRGVQWERTVLFFGCDVGATFFFCPNHLLTCLHEKSWRC